jgi:hypothetical protein
VSEIDKEVDSLVKAYGLVQKENVDLHKQINAMKPVFEIAVGYKKYSSPAEWIDKLSDAIEQWKEESNGE